MRKRTFAEAALSDLRLAVVGFHEMAHAPARGGRAVPIGRCEATACRRALEALHLLKGAPSDKEGADGC